MIKIKVWEDFVCPYCYIAMKNWELAAAEAGAESETEVLSFELNPEADPAASEGWLDSLSVSLGSRENALQGLRHSVEMARAAGLAIDVEKAVMSSSHEAHRVLQYAKRQSNALGKAFFKRAQRAFFAEGRALNEPQTLLELAAEVGLSREAVQEVLEKKLFEKEIAREQHLAEARPINYVPFFIFPSGRTIEGVLSKEQLLAEIRRETGAAAPADEGAGQ